MPEKRVSRQQKTAVIARAAGICEYCASQSSFAMDPFSVEHIIPRSIGGKTELDNLALACQGCNSYKYAKIESFDVVSQQTALLYNPRRQKWAEHFAWNADCSMIIGHAYWPCDGGGIAVESAWFAEFAPAAVRGW